MINKFLLYLLPILLLCVSCTTNKKTDKTNSSEMQLPTITEQDLDKVNPTTIKTSDGYANVYAVIIYTDNPKELKEKGILVQSVSKNFVTAFIKKSDLPFLNNSKNIKSIDLPNYDNTTN